MRTSLSVAALTEIPFRRSILYLYRRYQCVGTYSIMCGCRIPTFLHIKVTPIAAAFSFLLSSQKSG
jgi:hypothetical protein